jgi:uncharacterized protein with ATP-grasp and redox domains
MGQLDREKLLEKQELEIVKVDLGNNEFVYVRAMTGHERNEFERSILREVRDKRGRVRDYEASLEDYRAKLAVFTVCDNKGELLLKATDVRTLSHNVSAARLEKIVNEAQRLNAITEEDREELLKNLEGDPGANSSSDSAGN